MRRTFAAIYQWTRASRARLLDYLEGLPAEDLTRRIPHCGHGSIHNLLIHTADCYRYWLDRFAFGTATPALRPEEYPDLPGARGAFARADAWMERFLERYAEHPDRPIRGHVTWQAEPLELTPRWLFMHTVTHEFHHKGQVVMLGRMLGFPPPETDLSFPWDAGI